MFINHVTSNDTYSGIFEAIFSYFREHAGEGNTVVASARPDPNADIHHYHRCHLESALSDRAVCTVHHDFRDPDPWVRPTKFLPRYQEAKLVICLNEGQRAFLAKHGIERTVVIPHGYNERVLRPKAREPRATDRRITLGIISKYYARRVKGEAYLLDLAKRLSPDRFQFILVGEGRLRTAEDLIKLGYRVRLFEMLPYKLFQSLYDSIDYLLMCSTFEGGPANLSEAMATHTPILATPVGIAPDFIENRRNGLLLTENADIDARAIQELECVDGTLSATLRQNAPELRDRCPTWGQVVDRHLASYEKWVGGEL